ncbi:T9SS type A sorting domain-containing protein [Aquimarina agarivorans]|uniref:T9SS type A sorting domain-containing protein n=1 Tax=Aquimarina agarivorans TaxID=980584 RepID=UPI000248E6D3|nr:T9SS type A sorting domain-containing protein [Aquimarina agarivorans]
MKKITLLISLLTCTFISVFSQTFEVTGFPATVNAGDVLTLTVNYSYDTDIREYDNFRLLNIRELTPSGDFVAELGGNNTTGSVAVSTTGMGSYDVTFTVPDPLPSLGDSSNVYGIGGYVQTKPGVSPNDPFDAFAVTGNSIINVADTGSGTAPSVTFNSDVVQNLVQGETVMLEISYKAQTSASELQIGVSDAPSFFFPGTLESLGGDIPDGTVTVEYQVPGGLVTDPDTSIESDFVVFINATSVNANQNGIKVFIDEASRDAALSTNDFSKDNISASISQKDGIVTIADSVETEDYKLYDMTGALVIEKKADGQLDINGLPNGIYILSTDSGLVKIGK